MWQNFCCDLLLTVAWCLLQPGFWVLLDQFESVDDSNMRCWSLSVPFWTKLSPETKPKGFILWMWSGLRILYSSFLRPNLLGHAWTFLTPVLLFLCPRCVRADVISPKDHFSYLHIYFVVLVPGHHVFWIKCVLFIKWLVWTDEHACCYPWSLGTRPRCKVPFSDLL